MRIDRILDLHEDLTAEAVHGIVLPNGWWLPTRCGSADESGTKPASQRTSVRAGTPSSLSTVQPSTRNSRFGHMFVAK
jgi:hypothetical protein